MPLDKQLVHIDFTGGIDTKTDPRLVIPGKLTRMENAVFRGGTIQKPWGTSTSIPATTTTGIGVSLVPYDSQLLALTDSGALVYDAFAGGTWTAEAGPKHFCTISNKQLVANNRFQRTADQATLAGITVVAWWEDSGDPGNASGAHIMVFEEATGMVFASGAAAGSGSYWQGGTQSIRCVAAGSNVILVLFYDNHNGKVWVATVTMPTSPTAAPVVSGFAAAETDGTALSTGAILEAIPFGNEVLIAYPSGASGKNVTVAALGPAGTELASPSKTSTSAVNTATITSLAMATTTDGNLFVFANSASGGSQYFVVKTADFTSVLGVTTVASASTVRAAAELTTNQVTLACNGGTAVVDKTHIVTAVTAITGIVFGASYGISSTIFSLGGSNCILVIADPGGLQPTGLVINIANGDVLAKILPGLCGTVSDALFVFPKSNVIKLDANNVQLLVPQQGRLTYTSASGTITNITPFGVTRCSLSIAPPDALPVNRLGNSLYVGGANPKVHDSIECVEAGFPFFPPAPTIVLAGSGGSLSVGAYQWRVVYCWTNARGEIQRSAPSAASTSATAVASDKATVTVSFLSLSGRDAAAINNVSLEVYRTTANGTLYYRTTTPGQILNTNGGTTTTFVDGGADTSITSNELLYTAGGVLDNVGPPAYRYGVASKDRLLIAGLEDPYEYRISTQSVRGEMLRFNEVLGGRVPSQFGPITGVSILDSNWVIFTSTSALVLQGDGPDRLGNNQLSAPQVATGDDDGCIAGHAIVQTESGLLYRGSRGWSLLTRGLQRVYVGAAVEQFNDLRVRVATVRPELEQVWIHVDDGSDVPGTQMGDLVPSRGGFCLVYDYHYKDPQTGIGQWSVLTNYGAQGACYYQGKYTRLRSDGTIYQETPGLFGDSGVARASTIETAWLKFAGVRGFQRIWHALISGLYGSDFTLTWDMAVDYAQSDAGPIYPSANTITFAAAGVYTPGQTWQLRRHLGIQKGSAVRFRFADSSIGGNLQGMGLSSMTLEVGLKKGAAKLPATQST